MQNENNKDQKLYWIFKALSVVVSCLLPIWAICEKGSTLSKADVRYKSDIHDYESSALELVKILNDNGFVDEDYSFNDYYQTRLTALNELYQKEFNRNVKLKQELKELKSKKRNRFF